MVRTSSKVGCTTWPSYAIASGSGLSCVAQSVLSSTEFSGSPVFESLSVTDGPSIEAGYPLTVTACNGG